MAKEVKIEENGNEEEVIHGNTGLPFGLCAKYGIALPKNATPRDAWNALAGRGIYPPWDEKGKDQYNTDEKDTNKEHLTERQQKTATAMKEKMSKFSPEFRNKIGDSLLNLTDEEANIVSNSIDNLLTISSGGGNMSIRGIVIPSTHPTANDIENGYDFRAGTFYHELGHFLDSQNGGGQNPTSWYSNSREANVAYYEDMSGLMKRISNEMGIKPIDISRMSREQYQAINDWVSKYSGSADSPKLPQKKDYYKVTEPIRDVAPSWYSAEQTAKLKNDWDKYKAYVSSDEYKKDTDLYKEAQKKYDDKIKELAPRKEKAGFVTDFIGGITGGKVNPYKNGEWGHSSNYHKNKKDIGMFGIETFAEYNAARMTKDSKQLSMMKEILPKTVEHYEKLYAKYKEE